MDNDEKTIKAFLYDRLVNCLLSNANITYYNDSLSFDNSNINELLKMLNPNAYYSRMEELKKRKEEESKDD